MVRCMLCTANIDDQVDFNDVSLLSTGGVIWRRGEDAWSGSSPRERDIDSQAWRRGPGKARYWQRKCVTLWNRDPESGTRKQCSGVNKDSH